MRADPLEDPRWIRAEAGRCEEDCRGYRDVEAYLADRAEWHEVYAVRRAEDAWGIVLLLDGYYFSEETAWQMADYTAKVLLAALRSGSMNRREVS